MFDSKVTTGAGLAELHHEGITFLTLRQRPPNVIDALEALPDDAWTTVTLDRKGRHRKPQVHEDIVTVRGCDVPLRQIAVRGLGHDHPTLIPWWNDCTLTIQIGPPHPTLGVDSLYENPS